MVLTQGPHEGGTRRIPDMPKFIRPRAVVITPPEIVCEGMGSDPNVATDCGAEAQKG
jgi:hypothetical protein